MPGRHQHGTTNKNLGRILQSHRNQEIEEGERYYVAAVEGVNGSVVAKHLDCSANDARCFREVYTREPFSYSVIVRNMKAFPFYTNAVRA